MMEASSKTRFSTVGRYWSETRKRRIIYAIVALLLAILVVVPTPYVARVKVLPRDNTGGVSALFNGSGGAQGLAVLLGAVKAPTDLYLSMGRSDDVQKAVIKRLDLVGPGKMYDSLPRAQVSIDRKVDIRSLLGGVIEIVATTYDPEFSQDLVDAYKDAIADKILALAKEQVDVKRQVAARKLADAQSQVAKTGAALRIFQERNRVLLSPEAQFGAELSQRVGIESQLQAKLVALRSLQESAGPENYELNRLQTEIAALRAQLSRLSNQTQSLSGPNAVGLTALSSKYLDLYRNYMLAQAVYEIYARFAEQSALEELLSDQGQTIQLVEAPHIDAERHYNLSAMGVLALLILIAFITEIYGPATGIRIPGIPSSDKS